MVERVAGKGPPGRGRATGVTQDLSGAGRIGLSENRLSPHALRQGYVTELVAPACRSGHGAIAGAARERRHHE